MTERKSSEFFLPNETEAELRRPENSAKPFPFACAESRNKTGQSDGHDAR